jgi:hypothetical protein
MIREIGAGFKVMGERIRSGGRGWVGHIDASDRNICPPGLEEVGEPGVVFLEVADRNSGCEFEFGGLSHACGVPADP